MSAAQQPHHGSTPAPVSISVGDAADAYLDTLRVPSTRRVYTQVIGRTVKAVGGEKALADVEDLEIGQALQNLWGDAAASTWNSRRAAVSSWLAWCRQAGHPGPTVPPGAAVRPADEQTRASRIHSRAEIDHLTSRSDIPVRETTLWRMIYETDVPAVGLLDLNVEDLDLASRSAQLRSNDARRRGQAEPGSEAEGVVRRVFWGPATARLLDHHLQGRTAGPVFIGTQITRGSQRRTKRDIDPDTGYARLTYTSADKHLDRYTDPARRGTGWNLHELRASSRLHTQIDQAIDTVDEVWHRIGALDPDWARPAIESDLPAAAAAARDLARSDRSLATAGGPLAAAISKISGAVSVAQASVLLQAAGRQVSDELAQAMALAEVAAREVQAAALRSGHTRV